jgi:DAK2 domain fusion protein YloV
MATLEQLGADQLRAVVETFRDALRAHQEGINRLNVYPVPDGDTGTNMALTAESVVAELAGAEADMASTCKAISHGSLMGARGNSGVILSQILRGIASTFASVDAGDGAVVADALAAASEGAYGAVMRPVEGTILTVVREASEAAKATGSSSLGEVLEAARRGGGDALERTPELLPVLKEAGVVDAGGSGFLLLLDAALTVVDGRPLPEVVEVAAPKVLVHATVDEAHDSVSDLRYEVMYFLEAPDETIPAFKDVWAGIGDSIVVVGGDGIWNCHIHTDDIGASIEAALDVGRPSKIRVTDLMEQVEEERWVRDAAPEEPPALPAVTTAVVAVATGAGIERIFHSLGVQAIVTGGQSMNPSTAQLLDACDRVNADQVVILPNNKNIIPVAQQVDELSSKSVRVVATRGIAEGFAALLEYDPDADVDENVESMSSAAANVVAGEVTRAVRATTCDLGPIAEGDYIGIARDGIRAIDGALAGATIGLLDALITDDHEIVTLIEGDGSNAADTRRITEWLAAARPGVQVETHHGGQPLYPYLLGIE